MLVTLREIHHLSHLGFGNLMAEDANNRHPFFVHGQHDLKRLGVGHAEKPLQNDHHKLHRSEVVI